MAEITAHRRRGRMTAHVSAFVPVAARDWLTDRAAAESERTGQTIKNSDILRWIIAKDIEAGVTPMPGITIRKRRGVADGMVVSAYVPDEMRDWLQIRATAAGTESGLPVRRGDVLIWLLQREMGVAPPAAAAPRRKSRREILAS